ncbi:hypothetical protein BZG36_03828, partial [Bifiguratus adelaidae]
MDKVAHLFHGTPTPEQPVEQKRSSRRLTGRVWTSTSHVGLTEKAKPPILQQLKSVLLASWVNVLCLLIPFGIASHFVGWPPTATFIINFFAIVPLAKLLGFVTEELAMRTGETIGGLLNATFGNAVELIISIIALTQNPPLIRVVQASMLGSILSNICLVLGCCFLFGGIRFKEQAFNVTAAQTSAALMAIATSALLLPAAFYGSVSGSQSVSTIDNNILSISRATAVILLIVYASYLFFQLKTHVHLPGRVSEDREGGVRETPAEEEGETPTLSLATAIFLLVIVTVLVALCAEFLVDAIQEVVQQWGLTQTFVGLILLPIVGNAAEHVTAVTVAIKNKMDLAIGVAVGSSMQIALLVTPLMVIIGWGMNVPMSLYFNVYETAVMFITVLIVNYLINVSMLPRLGTAINMLFFGAFREEDKTEFTVDLLGAKDTPYADGVFRLKVQVGDSLETVLISISVLLGDPNPDDPLDADIAAEYKSNRKLFREKAREHTRRYAISESVVDSSRSSDKDKDNASIPTEKGKGKEDMAPVEEPLKDENSLDETETSSTFIPSKPSIPMQPVKTETSRMSTSKRLNLKAKRLPEEPSSGRKIKSLKIAKIYMDYADAQSAFFSTLGEMIFSLKTPEGAVRIDMGDIATDRRVA